MSKWQLGFSKPKEHAIKKGAVSWLNSSSDTSLRKN